MKKIWSVLILFGVLSTKVWASWSVSPSPVVSHSPNVSPSPSLYGAVATSFSSAQAAAMAFLNPLKQGVNGISQSMKALPISGSSTSSDDLVSQTLMQIMGNSGQLISYTEQTGLRQTTMGGRSVKEYYTISFTSGPSYTAYFLMMKTTLGGGYMIMDVEITQSAPSSASGSSSMGP